MNTNANRKTRYDKGHIELTERDLHVLRWIGEQYAARFDQVRDLLGQEAGPGAAIAGEISASAARQVVARWRRAGWIMCRKLFAYEEPWLHMTALGLRQLGLPYKPSTPSFVRFEHLFALNEVRFALTDHRPEDRWISERTIRAELSYEKGMSLPHIPDAKLITLQGITAIEAELTAKSSLELLHILDELVRTYETVWYFVADEARAGVLAARSKLEPDLASRVHVYRYSNTVGLDDSEDWRE